MKNEYKVFLNLDNITKDLYKKHFLSENYNIIFEEKDIVFVKKEYNSNINYKHENIILQVIESIIRKMYKINNSKKVIIIDFTNDVEQIMKKIEDIDDIKSTDNRITWQIRQTITKALLS